MSISKGPGPIGPTPTNTPSSKPPENKILESVIWVFKSIGSLFKGMFHFQWRRDIEASYTPQNKLDQLIEEFGFVDMNLPKNMLDHRRIREHVDAIITTEKEIVQDKARHQDVTLLKNELDILKRNFKSCLYEVIEGYDQGFATEVTLGLMELREIVKDNAAKLKKEALREKIEQDINNESHKGVDQVETQFNSDLFRQRIFDLIIEGGDQTTKLKKTEAGDTAIEKIRNEVVRITNINGNLPWKRVLMQVIQQGTFAASEDMLPNFHIAEWMAGTHWREGDDIRRFKKCYNEGTKLQVTINRNGDTIIGLRVEIDGGHDILSTPEEAGRGEDVMLMENAIEFSLQYDINLDAEEAITVSNFYCSVTSTLLPDSVEEGYVQY